MPDTILEGDHPRVISAKFGWDWLSSFRGEDLKKKSSPLFLFLAWWPSWLEVGITEQKFGRGPPKDHSTKVWLQLIQWFLRRRLKCEMLTDGRRTKSDDNSSHGLKARWAKKVAFQEGWSLWSETIYWKFIIIVGNSKGLAVILVIRYVETFTTDISVFIVTS
jgi:hypothetical protein